MDMDRPNTTSSLYRSEAICPTEKDSIKVRIVFVNVIKPPIYHSRLNHLSNDVLLRSRVAFVSLILCDPGYFFVQSESIECQSSNVVSSAKKVSS